MAVFGTVYLVAVVIPITLLICGVLVVNLLRITAVVKEMFLIYNCPTQFKYHIMKLIFVLFYLICTSFCYNTFVSLVLLY